MLLKRILIILGIMCITSLSCAGLLLLGNRNNENEVNNSNQIDVYNNENSIIDIQEVINTDNIVVDENKQEEKVEEKVEENTSSVENVDNQTQNNEIISNNVINNEIKQAQNIQKEESIISNLKVNNEVTKTEEIKEEVKNEEIKEEVKIEENIVQEKLKEDVYTFKRNDIEIQNMINIAKRIIKENKDNRCDGLVDKVDSINFIVGKAGNLFYPLFDYRIENIVIDNFYPEFYVYVEDIYKNGEYLRTEYYFN